ncbi:hypothetical protein GCM10011321_22740 [Youhaiella tibetensis]|jgi:hypothetical protein|uniref:Uncharacterized protein n=1 Tax=Paradevosia tibetensis TaxID=1447062 RepID=A0A5B9DKL2_9HYPH|nr:hypothetical protein [Youhaiella tibetensis]AKR54563.1 hypothetical protein XM25_01820 [Devosia sp. H5989]QEE19683.1 hypothetical protein FNA67_05620 [Youhaiella tibetensis]GGF30920.1 hypothetical protein GCM10011321_22740 [Youhaiella tibetensis]
MIARVTAILGVLAAIGLPPAALAQDTAPAAGLLLELNAVQPSETGCRVTFLATNGLGKPLDKAAFEVALFNAAGGIERLVTLDFKALPAGKTKVLQFDLGKIPCDGLSRVLINDVAACTGTDVAAGECLATLSTDNKTAIQFGL